MALSPLDVPLARWEVTANGAYEQQAGLRLKKAA